MPSSKSTITRKGRVLAGLLAPVAFSASCDARDITTPNPTAPHGVSMMSIASSALGDGVLFPAATSSPSDVNSLQFQPFAQVPAGIWVVIRTSGSITTTENRACFAAATPFWACGTNSSTSPFSADFPSTVGPVQVTLTRAAGETRVLMRGSGNEAAVGLFYSGSPGTLAARLNLPANYWWELGYDPIPAYFFAGSYTISAEAVPPPLEVVEGAADASRMREYSVRPLSGLHLVNPAEPYYFQFWPAGAVTWRFVRGESVSDVPGSSGFEVIPVNECGFQPVCHFSPPGPGKMEATAYVEGQAVTVRSTAELPAPELRLACRGDKGPNRVTRGQVLTCNATANPSGTVSNLRWVFVDTMGQQIAGPANSASWRGTMVVSGRIQVSADLNGSAASKDTAIAVEARSWAPLRIRVAEVNPNHLAHPDSVLRSRDLGDGHVDTLSAYPGTRINTGPNTGWWYLDRELDAIPIAVHINYPAFQSGSSWWNKQHSGTWIDPAGNSQPYCAKGDVPTLRILTRRHEGSISASPGETSHTDAMRRYLATNRPQDRFESLLARDSEVQTFTFAETVRSYYRSWVQGDLLGISQHQPAGLTSVPAFPCQMRF
jgi:hypothetical protein